MNCKYCDGAGTITLVKATETTKALDMTCAKCKGTGKIESWYEVFINKGDEGTETIYKSVQKIEAIRYAAMHIKEYEFPLHLDRWELDDDGTPQPVEEIF